MSFCLYIQCAFCERIPCLEHNKCLFVLHKHTRYTIFHHTPYHPKNQYACIVIECVEREANHRSAPQTTNPNHKQTKTISVIRDHQTTVQFNDYGNWNYIIVEKSILQRSVVFFYSDFVFGIYHSTSRAFTLAKAHPTCYLSYLNTDLPSCSIACSRLRPKNREASQISSSFARAAIGRICFVVRFAVSSVVFDPPLNIGVCVCVCLWCVYVFVCMCVCSINACLPYFTCACVYFSMHILHHNTHTHVTPRMFICWRG